MLQKVVEEGREWFFYAHFYIVYMFTIVKTLNNPSIELCQYTVSPVSRAGPDKCVANHF